MPKVTDAHLAARREQIIEAAMTRFAEGGFHSTGMAEVIAATGLSAGAVYRYFPTKEDLVLHRFADHETEPARLVAARAEGTSPVAALRARFLDGLETSVDDGDEVTILPAVAGG